MTIGKDQDWFLEIEKYGNRGLPPTDSRCKDSIRREQYLEQRANKSFSRRKQVLLFPLVCGIRVLDNLPGTLGKSTNGLSGITILQQHILECPLTWLDIENM